MQTEPYTVSHAGGHLWTVHNKETGQHIANCYEEPNAQAVAEGLALRDKKLAEDALAQRLIRADDEAEGLVGPTTPEDTAYALLEALTEPGEEDE